MPLQILDALISYTEQKKQITNSNNEIELQRLKQDSYYFYMMVNWSFEIFLQSYPFDQLSPAKSKDLFAELFNHCIDIFRKIG